VKTSVAWPKQPTSVDCVHAEFQYPIPAAWTSDVLRFSFQYLGLMKSTRVQTPKAFYGKISIN
jgi:hypothetical protein